MPVQPFTGSLKILVVLSAPSDLPPLDLDAEWAKFQEIHTQNPNISATLLSQPSLADLRIKLLEDDWHVLHFLGHGGFDKSRAAMERCFVGPEGRRSRSPASCSRTTSRRSPACSWSSRMPAIPRSLRADEGQDPFRATAAALVQAGIPAVIAMQTPIWTTARAALSATFYKFLALRHPVDAALAEGRRTVRSKASLDWATPTLFTRIKDGNILGGRDPTARRPLLTSRTATSLIGKDLRRGNLYSHQGQQHP